MLAQGSARRPELIRLDMQPAHGGDELDGFVDQRLGLAGVRQCVDDARRRELVPDWDGDDRRTDFVGNRVRPRGVDLKLGGPKLDRPTLPVPARGQDLGTALRHRPVGEGGGGNSAAQIRRAHGQPARLERHRS